MILLIIMFMKKITNACALVFILNKKNLFGHTKNI